MTTYRFDGNKIGLYFTLAALIIALCFLLSGCTTSRHMVKSETDTKTQDKSVTKTETHTIISEKADTMVYVPPDTIKGERPLNDVLDGKPLVVENDGLKVTVSYNSTTKNVQAQGERKPVKVHVVVDRTTEQDQVIDQKNDIKTDTQTKNKEVTKTTSYKWIWWVAGILLLSGIGYVAYRVIKSRIL